MDKRETFKNINELHTIVENIFRQKQDVALLIDDNGLRRISGKINKVNSSEGENDYSIVINNEPAILLSQIVGINGIFHTDYTEC